MHPLADRQAILVRHDARETRLHARVPLIRVEAIEHADDADFPKAHALQELGQVGAVARQPRQIRNENHVDLAGKRRALQLGDAWAIAEAGARDREIGKFVDHLKAVLLRVLGAAPPLIVDRGLGLLVGGKPGVGSGAFHGALPLCSTQAFARS